MSFRLVAAIAACVSCSVAIADQSNPDNKSDNGLDTVVVTASRVEQPISDVIGSVTVITRDDIERRQPQSVQELLRGEAGIDIYNSGGLGKISGVFMRGANTDETLILIDGQRLGSATDGTTAIQFIPIEQIERVEIVRGPRSSLYGSDAIGGVIQIFTRKQNGFNGSISYGYHDTQGYTAGYGFNASGLRLSVTGNYAQTNGFNACRAEAATAFGGCFANEPDDDGYRNSSASARIGYAFGKVADLELSTLYSTGYVEYDGYFNQGRFTESSPGLKLLITPTQDVSVTLTAGVAHDDQDNYHNAAFLSRYNTEKQNASLLTDWVVTKDQNVTVGVDYLRDSIDAVLDPNDPNTVYAATARNSHGEFVQYLGKFSAHELSASLRNDQSSQYGSHNTGNLGWKWQIVEHALAFNAGWGKAFHAPTFNDLYFPFGANPDLKPEQSRSVELGISGSTSWLTWSLQSYDTRVKDLIALDSNFSPINTDAQMRGTELTAHGDWKKFYASINYTILDPRSLQDGANYNHLLPRRSRQSGRTELGYNVGSVQLSSSINIAGPRFDDLANSKRLGGYTTVDLGAIWHFCKEFSVQLKLNNILDHRYETAQYYYQEGRSAYVTFRYQPVAK